MTTKITIKILWLS